MEPEQDVISLRQLRIVRAVGDAQSFTGGALRLGLSQPAVTRAIGALEASLSTLLLNRNARGCSLTAAGQGLVLRANRIATLLETISPVFANGVTLAELHAGVAVHDAGSLSSAARNRKMSLSAISQSLSKLEARAEAPLFERRPHQIVPTQRGLDAMRTIRLTLLELDHAVQEIDFLKGSTAGMLRIGALPIAQPVLIPKAIEAVLDIYPDARVSIVDSPYSTLEHQLLSGEIDLIVGSLREDESHPDLVTHTVLRDDLAIVCSSRHRLAHSRTLSLDSLLAEEWVLPFPNVPLRTSFITRLRTMGAPAPTRYIEANSTALVRSLLSSGKRLAVVSVHQIYNELLSGELVQIQFPGRVITRPVGFTVRRSLKSTPLIAQCLSALVAAAQDLDIQESLQSAPWPAMSAGGPD